MLTAWFLLFFFYIYLENYKNLHSLYINWKFCSCERMTWKTMFRFHTFLSIYNLMVIKLYLYGTFLNLGYKDSNSTSTTVSTFIIKKCVFSLYLTRLAPLTPQISLSRETWPRMAATQSYNNEWTEKIMRENICTHTTWTQLMHHSLKAVQWYSVTSLSSVCRLFHAAGAKNLKD